MTRPRRARAPRIVHNVQASTPANYRAFLRLLTPQVATWDERWGWSVLNESRWEEVLNACEAVEVSQ